jgi:hypothetical protein
LTFCEKSPRKTEELCLGPEQVYNTDESSLFWRYLPTKTFFHLVEESAARRKMSKDRIMFMPCSYANNTHKLVMQVIGKVAKLRSFKNQSHPFIYREI